jgi:hypothetical protein
MTLISIWNPEFIQPISDVLNRGKKIVIFHQIPWSGGNQEWYLVCRVDELDAILRRGKVASAFTAYEWIDINISPTVDWEWIRQITEVLAQETNNRMLLIPDVVPDDKSLIRLVWIGEAEDIREYYEHHAGSSVIVGRIPPLWKGEIVRGYYPDANGIPQSGAY